MTSSLRKKIEAEHRMRELLRAEGLPEPDGVEYGFECIRLFFNEPKVCVIVELESRGDDPPDDAPHAQAA